MTIWRSLDEVPTDQRRPVVAIGNFDGVHLGHMAVLRRGRDEAGQRDAPFVAVTFEPHPMEVLRPQHDPCLLTCVDEKVALLEKAGVQAVLVLPFDRNVASWSPSRFVDTVLVTGLRAAKVVVGAKFRFGHRASGDVAALRELGVTRGFEVESVALDGGPQVWSSTYVRTCLATGDVTGANEALGRGFTVGGTVVKGGGRGHALGFPTANLQPSSRLARPADGVYAGWLERTDSGPKWPAAISVGSRPTFGDDQGYHIEGHVLDRSDLELYDARIILTFVDRLRDTMGFDSAKALSHQIAEDVEHARSLLLAGGFRPGEVQ